MSERISSHASFWNERFRAEPGLFGVRPNAFIASECGKIPAGAEVVELGAGEGRNPIFLADERGCDVTGLDFSPEALATARKRAAEREVNLRTEVADLRTWKPSRQWDAILITFVQLLPEERERLYQRLQQALRPRGKLLAEWFRPDHLKGTYARIGPSTPDRMVAVDELRAHFPANGIERCEPADTVLDEGPKLQGRAAVVRFIFSQPVT